MFSHPAADQSAYMYLTIVWSNKKAVCVFLSAKQLEGIILLGVRSWRRWENRKVHCRLGRWGVMEYEAEAEAEEVEAL